MSVRRYGLIGLSLFICLTALYLLFSPFYSLTISNSDSMDAYFFITLKKNKIVKDGYAVAFMMPSKKVFKWKKYYGLSRLKYEKGEIFLKYVGCSSGEILNTVGRSDYCDGRLLTSVPKYLFLIPQPHVKIKGFPVWHNYRIPAGYFFATCPNEYGLDSRYFGLIKESRVLYNIVPLRL